MAHHDPKVRNAFIEWAKNILSRPNDWVIWDTETTGLGNSDEIIQIGVLGSDGSVPFDSLIRPTRRERISPEATAVHGITISMLVDQPTYPEIVDELIPILKGKSVIAYNAEYEERILRQTVKRNGGPSLSVSWKCAMVQYARYVGEWMDFKQDYKWQKLPSVEHSAIGDCRATLKVIQMMAGTP